MKTAQVTLATIQNAHTLANGAYIKRKGTNAKLNPSGMQDDIETGARYWSKFSAAQWVQVSQYFAPDSVEMLARTGNVKTLLRLPSLIQFCITGDRRALQGSAKVAVAALVGLGTGAKTRDALAYASTGKGNEHTSDVIDTAKSTLARKALGYIVGPSTEPTQYAVAFGDGNMLDLLRTAHKKSVRALPDLNRSSPVYIAIAKHVNSMTERDLLAWVEETEQKGAKRAAGKGKVSK